MCARMTFPSSWTSSCAIALEFKPWPHACRAPETLEQLGRRPREWRVCMNAHVEVRLICVRLVRANMVIRIEHVNHSSALMPTHKSHHPYPHPSIFSYPCPRTRPSHTHNHRIDTRLRPTRPPTALTPTPTPTPSTQTSRANLAGYLNLASIVCAIAVGYILLLPIIQGKHHQKN